MARRRMWIQTILMSAVLGDIFYCCWTYDLINENNFARIRFDMTAREVEELLGRKPDRCSGGTGTWTARNGDEITVVLLGRGICNTHYREHRRWYENVVDWVGLVQHVRE